MKHQHASVFVVCGIAFLALALTGCSNLNGTRLEPVLGGDVNLVRLGDKVAETLITNAVPPLLPRQANQPVLIATLVNNDNLDDTSSFGRSFQNNITAGFVNRGYAVKEIKLRREMMVEMHKGEFMLTRDLQELAGKQQAQAIVVGTYTMANRVMYLSVRLVSSTDQSIRSAFEDKLYLDEISLRMLGIAVEKKDPCGDPGAFCPPSTSIIDRVFN